MKVTKEQLKEMIREAVKRELMTESSAFTAKRTIIDKMTETSRLIEKDMIDIFKLSDPDHLPVDLQRRYLEIVEKMQEELIASAMKAAQQLLSFPKQEEQK